MGTAGELEGHEHTTEAMGCSENKEKNMAEDLIGHDIKEEKVKDFLNQRNCGAPNCALRFLNEVEVREGKGLMKPNSAFIGEKVIYVAIEMPAGSKKIKQRCEKKDIKCRYECKKSQVSTIKPRNQQCCVKILKNC